MPILITLITQEKLIIIKQTYRQTMVQSALQPSVIGVILSAIGSGSAIETMLGVAYLL